MESYFNRCGMCVHCNLYDKDSWSGAFKCEERGLRVKVTEEPCSRFENDSRRTASDIEYARAHENGLKQYIDSLTLINPPPTDEYPFEEKKHA